MRLFGVLITLFLSIPAIPLFKTFRYLIKSDVSLVWFEAVFIAIFYPYVLYNEIVIGRVRLLLFHSTPYILVFKILKKHKANS